MSCLIIFRNKEIMIWGADTAYSGKHNGELYRISDYSTKISIIGGKLIFCAGSSDVIPRVLNTILHSNDQSVDNIANIVKFFNDKYDSNYQKEFDSRGIDVTVGYYKDGETVLYNIIPENNYVPTLLEPREDGRISIHIVGYDADKMLKNISNYNDDPEVIMTYGFNSIASAGVGGNIVSWRLDKYGVLPFINKKIDDPKDMKRLDQTLMKLVKIPTIEEQFNSTVDYFRFQQEQIAGSFITGVTIQTAPLNNERIILSDGGFKCLNSLGQLNGWVLSSGNFSDFQVYYNGQLRGSLSQIAGDFILDGLNAQTIIRNNSSNILIKPGSTTPGQFGDTKLYGNVDFSQANVTGLKTVATFG